ncbi:hypothetical protein Tco_0164078 [Tanacetum coccineum]
MSITIAADEEEEPMAENEYKGLCRSYSYGLANLETEPPKQPISKLEFEFERRRLTKIDVRELIYRKILEYHPQMLQEYLHSEEHILRSRKARKEKNLRFKGITHRCQGGVQVAEMSSVETFTDRIISIFATVFDDEEFPATQLDIEEFPCHNATQTVANGSFSGHNRNPQTKALLLFLELPYVLDQSAPAQSLASSISRGDIVLFGNRERMKRVDQKDLLDTFLDNCVEILSDCLAPLSGWKDLNSVSHTDMHKPVNGVGMSEHGGFFSGHIGQSDHSSYKKAFMAYLELQEYGTNSEDEYEKATSEDYEYLDSLAVKLNNTSPRCIQYAEQFENKIENDKEDVSLEESSDESEGWDCETIITTYSNLDNHPGRLKPREEKKIWISLLGDPVLLFSILASEHKWDKQRQKQEFESATRFLESFKFSKNAQFHDGKHGKGTQKTLEASKS